MAYSTGMMNKRVTVAQKDTDATGAFGRNSAGVTYTVLGTFWAAVSFVRGVRAMSEEAVTAFDTQMVRMRYHAGIDRDCLLGYDGKCYAIQSLNEDRQDNVIQMTVVELPDKSPDEFHAAE